MSSLRSLCYALARSAIEPVFESRVRMGFYQTYEKGPHTGDPFYGWRRARETPAHSLIPNYSEAYKIHLPITRSHRNTLSERIFFQYYNSQVTCPHPVITICHDHKARLIKVRGFFYWCPSALLGSISKATGWINTPFHMCIMPSSYLDRHKLKCLPLTSLISIRHTIRLC